MVLDRIEDALAAMARGAMAVVVDDEDRENEGDLILAAEHATPEAIAFMVRHTSGMLCVGLPGERLDELVLPLMVERNTDSMRTAYTVTVDLRHGTTTGISAADRAATVRALVDPAAAADDFNRPGQYRCLGSFGLAIAERVPLTTPPTRENVAYLRTKQTRLGHVLDLAEEPPAVH